MESVMIRRKHVTVTTGIYGEDWTNGVRVMPSISVSRFIGGPHRGYWFLDVTFDVITRQRLYHANGRVIL